MRYVLSNCPIFLKQDKKEFVLSKQVLRSGTAIGALIREAEFGQSRADFANKMSISLKEANETEYWLSLLRDTDLINENQFKNYTHKFCGGCLSNGRYSYRLLFYNVQNTHFSKIKRIDYFRK